MQPLHFCSFFQHTEALKCVCVWMCVSESVTSLCHCELKAFQLESKHCSKYKREAEEQKQRRTHSQTGRIQCDRGRASEQRREERRARLRLRHTAETGIKELESKEREREEGDQRRKKPNHCFLFTCVRDSQRQPSDVFLCIYILHLGVRTLHCYRGNRRVQGRKSTLFPKEQTVRAQS